MKWPIALATAAAFSGCITLENRRDLYTADYDRQPVSRSAITPVRTTATETTTRTQRITTRKPAPELKPMPTELDDEANLPSPLPPPPP